MRIEVIKVEKKKLRPAEDALTKIAERDGKSVSEVRKEIQKAILVGMCSQDPSVQAYWKRIQCEGELPTPEELIDFLANEAKNSKIPQNR